MTRTSLSDSPDSSQSLPKSLMSHTTPETPRGRQSLSQFPGALCTVRKDAPTDLHADSADFKEVGVTAENSDDFRFLVDAFLLDRRKSNVMSKSASPEGF